MLLQCNKQWKFHRNQLMGTSCFCAGSNKYLIASQVYLPYTKPQMRYITGLNLSLEKKNRINGVLFSLTNSSLNQLRTLLSGLQKALPGRSARWSTNHRLNSPAPLRKEETKNLMSLDACTVYKIQIYKSH